MATGRPEHPPELADRRADAEAVMLNAKRLFSACAGILCLSAAVPTPAASEPPPVFLLAWGTPGSSDGQFLGPSGVATDAAGNVYVADQKNYRIQKFTNDGTYLTQWGGFGYGDGQFYDPADVATAAAGNVYVADTENSRIQKFGYPPTPTVRSTWGRIKAAYR